MTTSTSFTFRLTTNTDPNSLFVLLGVTGFIANDEDGNPQRVLPFSAAHDVLETWRKLDADHRNFGWTGDADDTEPETAFAVWVDAQGKLQIEYLPPFWDGSMSHNAYDLDVLGSVTGIAIESADDQ